MIENPSVANDGSSIAWFTFEERKKRKRKKEREKTTPSLLSPFVSLSPDLHLTTDEMLALVTQ